MRKMTVRKMTLTMTMIFSRINCYPKMGLEEFPRLIKTSCRILSIVTQLINHCVSSEFGRKIFLEMMTSQR